MLPYRALPQQHISWNYLNLFLFFKCIFEVTGGTLIIEGYDRFITHAPPVALTASSRKHRWPGSSFTFTFDEHGTGTRMDHPSVPVAGILESKWYMAEIQKPWETVSSASPEAEQKPPSKPSNPNPTELTTRLSVDILKSLPQTPGSPYGLAAENAVSYLTVPRDMAVIQERDSLSLPKWRVELHGLMAERQPVGLDILGDTVIGLGKSDGAPPDLDLAAFDAARKGVSRRHALFRPTRNRLYIIDLGSTNGTKCNALPVGLGVATEVKDNDTVTLGNLTFTVRIISRPDVEPQQAPTQPPAALEPTIPAPPDRAQDFKEQPPQQPRLGPIRWLTADSLRKWLKHD